ncbi:MAG: hypothetical protein JWM14_1565 [Chitinophagaceae bacterium]|nr:hypothetical protein [Chitinophagaceae bacterium]
MDTDFNLLTKDGTIGFYQSCETTQIVLMNKKDQSVINLFTLCVFQESPLPAKTFELLTNKKRIKLTDNYSVGIHRYWQTIEEAERTFNSLSNDKEWDFNGDKSLLLGQVKEIPKQHIVGTETNPINKCLKNNFHSGSYLIEFFDEKKSAFDFLLKPDAIKLLDKLSSEIKSIIPIDLSFLRDRIGNIIFQFPITILESNSNCLSNGEGVNIYFNWHNNVESRPDCCIEVLATLDNNYMGASIVPYDKNDVMTINTKSIDQKVRIKIWRKTPNLLLSTFDGTYIRHIDFNMGVISHEPRLFDLNGRIEELQITSHERRAPRPDLKYTNFINSRLYETEKDILEKNLSFKQYGKGKAQREEALEDIRKLIRQNDNHGIYLWDPFLRPQDVFETLYFSENAGIDLKCIGAINKTVLEVYKKKKILPVDLINEYREAFNNPSNNNYGLNLEFRCQFGNHGWGFHDRFIMFPGSDTARPKAYSLGTSVNSLGKEHHILQEVSYPQRIIDAFNELWGILDKKECIVWKSRKK